MIAAPVLSRQGILDSSVETRIVEAVIHLAGQNPRAAARFVQAISCPPMIGSVKLSWRDGKFNAVEVTEQTY